MKVLMIAPTPFFADRGTHIRIWEEARAIEQLGHDVTIVTYHIGNDIQRNVDTTIQVKRINRLLFWYKKMEAGPNWQKMILDLLLVRKTWSVARQWKPDVLHAHLHEGVVIGWLVQKLLWWRPLPLVADFHGSLTGEMLSHGYLSNNPLKRFFRLVERWVNNLGQAAITSSPENTDDIARDRTVSPVTTILDGALIDAATEQRSQEDCRDQFSLPHDKTILVYTGAFLSNKGMTYLQDAMLELAAAPNDLHIVLGGYPANDIRAFVRAKNLEDIVTVVSPLSYTDLPALLRASDVAIDPKDSRSKQASGKILQYMAAGLPVVCFDRPNNRSYLGDDGCYATDTTGHALAAAIADALAARDNWTQMGHRLYQRAQKESWVANCTPLIDIYQSL